MLSAAAYGHDALEVAFPVADAAQRAVLERVEGERALLYWDLLRVALAQAPRDALEAMMRSGGYEYESEFARRYFDAGEAEGKAEGEASGRAAILLKQLEIELGALPDDARTRIARPSIEELDRWGERVLSADSLDALLA